MLLGIWKGLLRTAWLAWSFKTQPGQVQTDASFQRADTQTSHPPLPHRSDKAKCCIRAVASDAFPTTMNTLVVMVF